MAGKRTPRKRLSAKTDVQVPRTQTYEQQTWAMLPTDILEVILSLLTLKDNIRASAVCKPWQGVGISVRIADKPPWLMIFPKVDDWFEFYDPSQCKSYWLELPELLGCTVCYAKDGWLLLVKSCTTHIFFFCPYTQELIKLPNPPFGIRKYAFSASPKSSSCIVFAVENGILRIYRHGETNWSVYYYSNMDQTHEYVGHSNKVVFSKGCFYCVDLKGWVGIYNPNDNCWVIHSVPAPKCPKTCYDYCGWKRRFVAEYDGEIYVILTCSTQNPSVYRLDKRNVSSYSWVEMKSLEGITLFANYISSHGRINPRGLMMSSVCFPKIGVFWKKCVSYSLDHKTYYPRKLSFDWGEHYDSSESIWIEGPKDLSVFS